MKNFQVEATTTEATGLGSLKIIGVFFDTTPATAFVMSECMCEGVDHVWHLPNPFDYSGIQISLGLARACAMGEAKVGPITMATDEFIRQSIGPIVAPELFAEIVEKLDRAQAERLENAFGSKP